jgi:glutathione S-transferase
MTNKLYFSPGACSFVPHCLLEAIGLPFEPMLVKLHKGEHLTPEYRAINPRAQVPVLINEDRVVTQIVAICNYLHETHPELNFFPSDPIDKAKVQEIFAWMNNTVHATFTHVFMPQKFTKDEAAQQAIKSHATVMYRAQLEELQVMAASVAPNAWLSGEHFGALDAYSITLLRWGAFAGIDPQCLPTLWAFVQRVAQHPPVARAIERERLQLNVYKPA